MEQSVIFWFLLVFCLGIPFLLFLIWKFASQFKKQPEPEQQLDPAANPTPEIILISSAGAVSEGNEASAARGGRMYVPGTVLTNSVAPSSGQEAGNTIRVTTVNPLTVEASRLAAAAPNRPPRDSHYLPTSSVYIVSSDRTHHGSSSSSSVITARIAGLSIAAALTPPYRLSALQTSPTGPHPGRLSTVVREGGNGAAHRPLPPPSHHPYPPSSFSAAATALLNSDERSAFVVDGQLVEADTEEARPDAVAVYGESVYLTRLSSSDSVLSFNDSPRLWNYYSFLQSDSEMGAFATDDSK